MNRRLLLCLLCTLAALPALIGCSGSLRAPSTASSATAGRATVTLRWPEPGRLIPLAASSLRIDVRDSGGAVVASQVVVRPPQGGSASVVFDPLPVGNLSVQARAYPESDGTGVVQAIATAPLVIQAGQSTSFRLAMASTIDHIQITPSALTLNVAQTLPVAVTASNAAGEVVLTSARTLTWSSQDPATAGVQSGATGGFVTGVQAGSTRIAVRETESGKSASMAVTTVGSPPVTPPEPLAGDDFNDNQMNSSLWKVVTTGTGATIAEVNQRVEVTISSGSFNPSLFGAAFRTRCALRGDFDVQVDYTLLTWPAGNGVRMGLWFGDFDSILEPASTHRVSQKGSSAPEYYAGVHTYVLGNVRLPTHANTGTLRLARTNGVFSSYYRDATTNQWVLIITGGKDTTDRPLNLFAWSADPDFSHMSVKVAFDNFVVNSGELICGP